MWRFKIFRYRENVLCRVVCSGRAIFNHVKIALRKIVRTLPANFKALTNHIATSHFWRCEKFYWDMQTGNFTGDATEGFSLMGEHGMGVPAV